ncbi:MAG: hypothetical protein Q8R43_01490 [Alphaproteobacteria bacterium]|nr:hypothetical protein [Alphaproteobacteria bacterium]
MFYLQVEDTPYKVHLNNDAACIKFRGDANGAHIALIKAWVATFKGQVISVTLAEHTE